MSSEAALRAMVKQRLDPFCLVQRIENPIDPGTPDDILLDRRTGAVGWLELKYLDTKDLRRPRSLTDAQVAWACKWGRAGGKAALLVQRARVYALLDWSLLPNLMSGVLSSDEIAGRALAIMDGGFLAAPIIKWLNGVSVASTN